MILAMTGSSKCACSAMAAPVRHPQPPEPQAFHHPRRPSQVSGLDQLHLLRYLIGSSSKYTRTNFFPIPPPSLVEALQTKTPLVGIPFANDQRPNLLRAQKNGWSKLYNDDYA